MVKEERLALMEGGSKSTDQLGQLVINLPQAKNSTELFSMFVQHAETMYPGLMHASILLLPKDTAPASGLTEPGAKRANSGTVPATSQGVSAKEAAGGTQGPLHCSTVDWLPRPADASGSWEPTEGFGSCDVGPRYLWSNCCVVHLKKDRGAIVQPVPSWPVACTATYHAALVADGVVVTGNYAARGPHFLDWKALAENGAKSMVAIPLYGCKKAAGALCLASADVDAFENVDRVRLLASILAPYAQLLNYSTQRAEMAKLISDIVTPIAAQLAHQKPSPTATGEGPAPVSGSPGKTVVEATGAGGGHGTPRRGGPREKAGGKEGKTTAAKVGSKAADVDLKANSGGTGSSPKNAIKKKGLSQQQEVVPAETQGLVNKTEGTSSPGPLSHKRFESVIVKSHPYDLDPLGVPHDVDLDWGDFFFNLVSMCIVYVYFSKAVMVGESLVAVLLCMGVAAFDIILLVMRWLWVEQYIQYGVVLHVFQLYRVVVLPVANTWMSWSLLNKMDITPGYGLLLVLGLVLVAFMVVGLQVRFFLHAPLQLASVLFAATSTPDVCGMFFDSTSGLSCIGIVSALQLSLGLVLPSLLVYCMEGRGARSFMPHMQAKRWLLHP